MGINDFTFNGEVPGGYYVSILLFFIVPLLVGFTAKFKAKSLICGVAFPIATVVIAFLLIPKSFSTTANEIVEYDYLVRHSKWDTIIEKATEKPSRHPIALISLNLALANKGLLDSDLMKYPQNGYKGLLEDTGRNGVAAFPTLMAYLQIGLPEVTFRGAFEFQESLPSYRKSGRCMKMLATAAEADNNPGLAEKYRRFSDKTLFYRADDESGHIETSADMDRGQGSGRVGNYSELKLGPDSAGVLPNDSAVGLSDQMFYFADTADWLAQISRKQPANKIARQYLVAWLLLTCDMDRLEALIPLISTFYEGGAAPRVVQEAAAYIALKNNIDYHSMPISISDEVMNGMIDFRAAVSSGLPANMLIQRFPESYWTYLVTNQ